MIQITGILIKMNRIQQNMSQKALCEGICVPSYLSKIENGEIVPASELVNLLFEVLGIHYNDDTDFMKEGTNLFERYLERLSMNDFEGSNKLYAQIEQDAYKYIHSPLIIDYYLVRLARYCASKERLVFEESERMLVQVYQQMDARQKLLYNMYKAIDMIQETTAYDQAIVYLQRGLEQGENGHLYYWLSMTYLYKGATLQAYDYAKQAIQQYLSESNILSVMSSHELIARIYMTTEAYDEAQVYLQKAIKMCANLREPFFEVYLANQLAWCRMCLGDPDAAVKWMQGQGMGGLMMRLEAAEIKAVILYELQDKQAALKLLSEVEAESIFREKPVFRFLRGSLQAFENWEESEKERCLIEMVDASAKRVDMQIYFKRLLIAYYKDKRRYKEAMLVLEKS